MSGRRKIRQQRQHRTLLKRLQKLWRKATKCGGRGGPRKAGPAKPFRRFLRDSKSSALDPDQTLNLSVPKILGFDQSTVNETIEFFHRLRKKLADRHKRKLVLDARELVQISPDAALVLIAEMFYGDRLNRKLKKMCHFPKNPEVQAILKAIGFFRYFSGNTPEPGVAPNRDFLQHMHGRKVEGKHVKTLINHFQTLFEFGPVARHTLFNALIECQNNVLEHAYRDKSKRLTEYHEWWMLGYCDPASSEICFSFYDQGLGIPKTIRARLRDTIRKGSSLIRQAVEQGLSRTKKITRGRGLPSLKKFVDVSSDGNLSIVSLESQCVFHKGVDPKSYDHPLRLQGTLITWNICGK